MARRKETLWQTDFSLGAVRPEVVAREDSDLVLASVKIAENTVSLSTGQLEARPGLAYDRTTTAVQGFHVDLGAGRIYDLAILPSGYELRTGAGSLVTSGAVDWTALAGVFGAPAIADIVFWMAADADTGSIIIGSQYFPMQVLAVDSAGAWTFGPFAYDVALGGRVALPFYRHHRATLIEPSGYTGAITLTASGVGSDLVWSDAHDGMYVRYYGKTILLGTRVSDTVINATVIEELPLSYDVVIGSSDGFKSGDIVEDSVLGGTAIVVTVGIFGTDLIIQGLDNWTGWAVNSDIVGPNASQEMTTLTPRSAPLAMYLWDMQMFNPINGYAGWGARHKGRLYLCDAPSLPSAYAVSQPGFINNFQDGPDDGDAFVETIGSDTGGSLKYIISTGGDLLFFTTAGCYYQFTRDGNPITPLTISPVSFTRFGCAEIVPAVVDDGVVFVADGGQQIMAAVLTGDVYKSWKARSISKYHSHLIVDPVGLSASITGAREPEQYVYVTLADGTLAVCQWDLDEAKVSWRPWSTVGSFASIYGAAGNVVALVDRTIDGAAVRFSERFVTGLYVDACAALDVSSSATAGAVGVDYIGGVTALAPHLYGETPSVYYAGWDLGDRSLNASGEVLNDAGNVVTYGETAGVVQVGLPVAVRLVPWPRKSARTQSGVREVKRQIECLLTVQGTGLFSIDGDQFNGYMAGDDVDLPPPVRDRQVRITLNGGNSFREIEIARSRPGPFRILKIGYRVVI